MVTSNKLAYDAVIDMGTSNWFTSFDYPGGETQVRLTEEGLKHIHNDSRVAIVSRITSPHKMMDTLLLCSAIRGVIGNFTSPDLILPYLPYARADRRFTNGDCFGLDVFGCVMESMVHDIFSLDVHSEQSKRFVTNIDPSLLVEQAVMQFGERHKTDRINILYPDKGAMERYTTKCGYGYNLRAVFPDYFFAEKKRDQVTGKFIGFNVPDMPNRPTLVIDDICDGGGTFAGIGEKVRGSAAPMGLYVTHGIFSNGFKALKLYYEHIWTTDSFVDYKNRDELEKFGVTVFDSVKHILEQIKCQ